MKVTVNGTDIYTINVDNNNKVITVYKDNKEIELNETDEIYLARKTRYNLNWATNFIKNRTSLSKHTGTLVDIGCGDGLWAYILSEWYNVTAEDPNIGGILAGELKNKDNKIRFLQIDSLKSNIKHDMVFARCPSFFNKLVDTQFITDFEKIFQRCTQKFIFIVYSKAPFKRQIGSSYYHDPKELEQLFSKYGKTTINYSGHYIVGEIKKD